MLLIWRQHPLTFGSALGTVSSVVDIEPSAFRHGVDQDDMMHALGALEKFLRGLAP